MTAAHVKMKLQECNNRHLNLQKIRKLEIFLHYACELENPFDLSYTNAPIHQFIHHAHRQNTSYLCFKMFFCVARKILYDFGNFQDFIA